MSENMKLWSAVCKTDPAKTKKGKKGGYAFTAICPQYQREMATKAFGPYGIGWGIEPGSEVWDRYQIGESLMCEYHAILFAHVGGKESKFPIQSSILISYKTKDGYIKTDDDYAKKIATDALTKGLSYLGFNADVFTGMFDDSKYIQERSLSELAESLLTSEMKLDYVDIVETEDAVRMMFFDHALRVASGYSNESFDLYAKCVGILQDGFPDGKKTKYKTKAQELIKYGLDSYKSKVLDAINAADDIAAKELVGDAAKEIKKQLAAQLTEQESKTLGELLKVNNG